MKEGLYYIESTGELSTPDYKKDKAYWVNVVGSALDEQGVPWCVDNEHHFKCTPATEDAVIEDKPNFDGLSDYVAHEHEAKERVGKTLESMELYGSLQDVLQEAYTQASEGKGSERHGNGLAFEEQPMQTISGLLGTNQGMLFQAIKKIQESVRMDTHNRRKRELLGAIVYVAGAIMFDANNSD